MFVVTPWKLSLGHIAKKDYLLFELFIKIENLKHYMLNWKNEDKFRYLPSALLQLSWDAEMLWLLADKLSKTLTNTDRNTRVKNADLTPLVVFK